MNIEPKSPPYRAGRTGRAIYSTYFSYSTLADAAQDPYREYVTGSSASSSAAIQQLPLEFREIIILREYEEFS